MPEVERKELSADHTVDRGLSGRYARWKVQTEGRIGCSDVNTQERTYEIVSIPGIRASDVA